MVERLIIRNFGPIKDVDINIKPLTIFIGTQGSGKSTISKLLTICRDVSWYINILDNTEVLKPFIDFSIDKYFNEDTYIHYDNKLLRINIYYNNKKFKIESYFTSQEELKKSIINSITKASNSLLKKTDVLKSPEDFTIDTNFIKANSRLTLYIPAERNLIGNLSSSLASILLAKIPLQDSIIEYMSLFEKAKKDFPKYEINFLGVSFEKKDSNEYNIVMKNGKELPLNACSSGLQSVLPMIMVIDYALKIKCFDSFVIEEPEQNLFPENQCNLLSFITSKQAEFYSKFLITTHSPYLLSYLNNLMLAYKLCQNDEIKDEVSNIVNERYMVNPENVAVYSLEPDGNENCKSIISEKTGLISINALDTASEFIGEDYDRLYKLFLKSKKNK